MKFLFIGDVHIKTDNSEEIDILMREIDRVCSEEKYDHIIVGGDVMHYHERLFTQCLNKSLYFLNKLAKIAYTYVLVGNHDYVNNSEFLTENHWMNSLKTVDNLKIVDNVLEFDDFILCPYVYAGRFIEALETVTKNWSTKKLIFAHQEFKGCKMGAIVSTEGDEWKEDYPYIISGHIHDNQKVGNNIYYPGTPLQHSFGDSDTRVLCDISLEKEKKTIDIKNIHLNVPKKYIIKTNLKDIKLDLKNIKEKNNRVKIKLDITNEEFKLFKDTKDYKELVDSGVKIQLNKKKENKNKIEYNEDSLNFTSLLENMVDADEEMVREIYNEVVLGVIKL